MNRIPQKVILHSISGYDEKHDFLLQSLIDEKIRLFCTIGKDCELFHDIMDELIVGDGTTELDFLMITTWHEDETLEGVIEFARNFEIEDVADEKIKIIEI
ncbi:MAG TPA: hypothetical protein PKY59_27315 [Pyrinomonadaceae bacterium]|nr:hypothetical protein [Pyrinomonadaceae bacterium]